MLAVELLRDRCDPLLGERAHRLAQELVLGGQVQVHGYAESRRASSVSSRTPYPVAPSRV